MLYLSIGSNLGDKRNFLLQAIALIRERVGRVVCISRFYETEPWGYTSTNTYLNAALEVETSLSALEVLAITQDIERELGRQRKSMNREYFDRSIDIDLLFYDNVTMSTPELTLPHPRMHERRFVMEPLAQIAPELIKD